MAGGTPPAGPAHSWRAHSGRQAGEACYKQRFVSSFGHWVNFTEPLTGGALGYLETRHWRTCGFVFLKPPAVLPVRGSAPAPLDKTVLLLFFSCWPDGPAALAGAESQRQKNYPQAKKRIYFYWLLAESPIRISAHWV